MNSALFKLFLAIEKRWREIIKSDLPPKEAERLGWKNGQMVSVEVKGKRAVIFRKVKIRINKNYRLCMHIDTDEGNAAGINRKGKGQAV